MNDSRRDPATGETHETDGGPESGRSIGADLDDDIVVNRRSVLKAVGLGTVGTPLAPTSNRLASELLPSEKLSLLSSPALVTQYENCTYPTQEPEIFGPTDVNAQTGNQGLSVGLNRKGTITVFRWPRPSFYDQIKYRTTDRDSPRFGAAPNAGAFLGLVVETAGGSETVWLREFETDQQYAEQRSDAVVTRYRSDRLGLSASVTDVVVQETDALFRRVRVHRDEDSPVTSAELLAFENFNLVVSKHVQSPTNDWCEEESNTDAARFHPDVDAIVHFKQGIDESTGEERSVAVAMGFDGGSDAHQVGCDAEFASSPCGDDGRAQDAYEDAADGRLRGNDEHVGQTTGAVSTELDFEDGTATETVVFAAASDESTVSARLRRARTRSFAGVTSEKWAWYRRLLANAPMPDTDDDAVLELANRALVTMVSNYDPESGALVASIATQSPYALDWVRDGAYFNRALDVIGLNDWVAKRNRWYAEVQQRATDPRPSHPDTPPGNWAMNYYADGVAGGPIPYEIDETGYGIWTLWDHYRFTRDDSYLRDVYPAIERAADYLVDCKDETTGLHCPAPEDDHPDPSQTVIGAAPVWLGLDSAVNAAEALERETDAERWARRRDELGVAIDTHLWDPDDRDYCARSGEFARAVAALAWPAEFKPFDHPRMEAHLDSCWERVEPAFAEPEAGNLDWGLYETKALLPLAKASAPGSERMEKVRNGLKWVACEHASPDTRVMGEAWLREDGDVVSAVSQPHTWEQILFYLASLEAYPP